MDQDTKRELRQLKREIKRKGGKIRRRQLKQGLIANPEEAQDTVVDFGRFESKKLNGLDRDQAWRQANSKPPGPATDPGDDDEEEAGEDGAAD